MTVSLYFVPNKRAAAVQLAGREFFPENRPSHFSLSDPGTTRLRLETSVTCSLGRWGQIDDGAGLLTRVVRCNCIDFRFGQSCGHGGHRGVSSFTAPVCMQYFFQVVGALCGQGG